MPGLGGLAPSTCVGSPHFHLPWLLGLTPSRAGADPHPSQGASLPPSRLLPGAENLGVFSSSFPLSVYLFMRNHGLFAFSLLSFQLEETHTLSPEAPRSPSCPPPAAGMRGFSPPIFHSSPPRPRSPQHMMGAALKRALRICSHCFPLI